MNYLSVENLTKSFGERVLFKDLSFGIAQGQKVALVAANGTGKSTLLKILHGNDTPDSGRVVFRQGVSIGYLDQLPDFTPTDTVLDILFASTTPIMQAVREYEHCMHVEVEPNRMQAAMENMERLKAWDYESKTKQILGKLGIHDVEGQVGKMSGGQQKRIALAKILLEEPEFLILDEPTNHLDLEMIEWLENYLIGLNKTLLLVTHDRYFLDSVCDEIIEIEQGKIFTYKGGYSYFLEKKSEREFMQNSEIDKARNLYRRELDWMCKQPRARGTKQKARIDSFYETEGKAKQQKVDEKVNLSVNMNRMGNKILHLNNVSKAFGDKTILKKMSYTFRRGERLGIVGKNGCGKTTFLNMILGLEGIDSGMIETGETMVFGYYTQSGLKLKEDKRVIEVVKDIAEFIPAGNGEMLSASQFLQHFLFSPEKQYTYVSKLSGGERRRLHLLTVLMRNPNFLILDEPTNDLDLLTLGILEEFLMEYQGCLVVVTHDRYFMDKLVDHLFIFEGDGVIRDYNGTYSEYRTSVDEDEKAQRQEKKNIEAKPIAVIEKPKPITSAKKLSFKEQRELELLDKEIPQLESQKEAIVAKLSTGSGTHEEIALWAKQIEDLINLIDEKTMRWLELNEVSA